MGGKASRNRTKVRRKKERRARKDSMNAQYAAWREAGVNTKSHRAKKNQVKRKVVKNFDHPDGACTNPACHKCHDLWAFNSFMLRGKPHNMRPRMYQAWQKQNT